MCVCVWLCGCVDSVFDVCAYSNATAFQLGAFAFNCEGEAPAAAVPALVIRCVGNLWFQFVFDTTSTACSAFMLRSDVTPCFAQAAYVPEDPDVITPAPARARVTLSAFDFTANAQSIYACMVEYVKAERPVYWGLPDQHSPFSMLVCLGRYDDACELLRLCAEQDTTAELHTEEVSVCVCVCL